jgi:hypothetical protein
MIHIVIIYLKNGGNLNENIALNHVRNFIYENNFSQDIIETIRIVFNYKNLDIGEYKQIQMQNEQG